MFFSLPSQEIGWEERLRNYLFCVEWDGKTLLHTMLLMLPPLTLTYIYEELLLANCGCVSTRVPGSSAAA